MTEHVFKVAEEEEKQLCNVKLDKFENFLKYSKDPTINKDGKGKRLVATIKRIKKMLGIDVWFIIKEPHSGIRVGYKLDGISEQECKERLKKHIRIIGEA